RRADLRLSFFLMMALGAPLHLRYTGHPSTSGGLGFCRASARFRDDPPSSGLHGPYQPDLGLCAYCGEGVTGPFPAAALCRAAFYADRVCPLPLPENTQGAHEGSHHHIALRGADRVRFLLSRARAFTRLRGRGDEPAWRALRHHHVDCLPEGRGSLAALARHFAVLPRGDGQLL